MGVDLYFSNQLMPLADKLHDNLRPDGDGATILEPPVVIVPNMNLSKWIKVTLARKSTIFMNVEFQYLEAGLWQMIRTLDPNPLPETERLDNDHLKILLFFILMTPGLDEPALKPVNHFLHPTDDGVESDFEIRCWQLSAELARLFQEYEYHRSDMIQRWLTDSETTDPMASLATQLAGRCARQPNMPGKSCMPTSLSGNRAAARVLGFIFSGCLRFPHFICSCCPGSKPFSTSTYTVSIHPVSTGKTSKPHLKKNGSNEKKSLA